MFISQCHKPTEPQYPEVKRSKSRSKHFPKPVRTDSRRKKRPRQTSFQNRISKSLILLTEDLVRVVRESEVICSMVWMAIQVVVLIWQQKPRFFVCLHLSVARFQLPSLPWPSPPSFSPPPPPLPRRICRIDHLSFLLTHTQDNQTDTQSVRETDWLCQKYFFHNKQQ